MQTQDTRPRFGFTGSGETEQMKGTLRAQHRREGETVYAGFALLLILSERRAVVLPRAELPALGRVDSEAR
jgi:hypothetical protein